MKVFATLFSDFQKLQNLRALCTGNAGTPGTPPQTLTLWLSLSCLRASHCHSFENTHIRLPLVQSYTCSIMFFLSHCLFPKPSVMVLQDRKVLSASQSQGCYKILHMFLPNAKVCLNCQFLVTLSFPHRTGILPSPFCYPNPPALCGRLPLSTRHPPNKKVTSVLVVFVGCLHRDIMLRAEMSVFGGCSHATGM